MISNAAPNSEPEELTSNVGGLAEILKWPDLNFVTATLAIRSETDQRLPIWKGSLLRGLLGLGLHRTVCTFKNRPCNTCICAGHCPYTVVFQPLPNTQRNPGGIPSYILDCEDSREFFRKGDEFEVRLTLFGIHADRLALFIHSLKVGFELANQHRLSIVNPESAQLLQQSARTIIGTAISKEVTACKLHLTTPFRVRDGGKLASDLSLRTIIGAVLRRLPAVWRVGSGEQIWVPVEEIFAHLDTLYSQTIHQRWVEQPRYSGRQQQLMSLGGITGSLRVSGDVTPLLPYLRLAEIFHIGKQCSFGNGKIRLTIEND